MAVFKVKLTAINPKDESKKTKPILAIVDTGSHMTWLPKKTLLDAGIVPRSKKHFRTASNQRLERECGFAILTTDKYTTVCEVVFAEANDMTLLGVRTLEGFGVRVDNINGRFEPVEQLLTGLDLIHLGEEDELPNES